MTITKHLSAAVASLCVLGGSLLADPRTPENPRASMAVSDPAPTAKADRDMKAVLDALAVLGGKPLASLTPDEARRQPTPADAVTAVMTKKLGKAPVPQAVAKVENRTYAGGDGSQLPLRIYTPNGKGPFPVVVYFHGGGWVIADLDVYDSSPRALANAAGAIIVSVEYRKAPEHKFPAAHDDAFAAYKWVHDNAASFGGDPERLAVAGESAGGNLAFNTAVRARDEKVTMPMHMLLIYPVAGADMTTPSYVANADAKPLGKAGMEWFVSHLFAKPAETKDVRLDLVHRADLRGLPSATVITAEIDPLRSEGQQLANNLMAAGIDVDAADYRGVTHEFFGMGAAVAKARRAELRAGKNLKAAFKKTAKVSAR